MQRKAVEGHPLVEALITYFAQPGATVQGKSARDLRDMLAASSPRADLPHFNQFATLFRRLAAGLQSAGLIVKETFNARRKVTVFDISIDANFAIAEAQRAADPHTAMPKLDASGEPLPF